MCVTEREVGGERGWSLLGLFIQDRETERDERMGVWMNGWMREGEKYLQNSTYNKYAAKRRSKQNTVVTKRGEGVSGGEWERGFII